MRFFLRMFFFCVGGILIFFSPWITLILGGLLYALFFRFPVEVLFWGLCIEILSGMTPGILILPLTGMLVGVRYAETSINNETTLSRASLFILGIIFFLSFRFIAFLFLFGPLVALTHFPSVALF